MLVKDLPQDIRDVVIKHHVKQRGKNLLTDSSRIVDEFNWYLRPEGETVWLQVNRGNFKPFRQFHHNQLKVGDTVEYFKPIQLADWNEFGVAPVVINFELGDKLKIDYVSSDDHCTIHFEKHSYNFPSHCFRKVEAVEEPQHPFKVGDRVRIKKEFFNLFNSDDLKHDTFIVNDTHKYSCFVPHSLEDRTEKNVISLNLGYGGWYLAECFELHVEQPKEEPVQKPIKDYKPGDKVVYYRVPTEKDWHGIGAVSIQFTIGSELTIFRSSRDNKSLVFEEEIAKGFHYPASCFLRKVTEKNLPSNWFVKCYKDIDKTPLLFEWRGRNFEYPIAAKWYHDGYISSTGLHSDYNLLIALGYTEITYEQFVRDVYQPWKETQAKVLNPIHQHYEDGGKIREKSWYQELYISKHGDNLRSTKITRDYDKYPDKWEIFVEQDDKRTSKKIISVSETTLSEVPEYWYFPLDGCTDDELDKFQKFKEDKASSYIDKKIRKSHILLNFHWDKSYYYTDRVEELITETWFHSSAVQLKKEEFYRLIYNPWQDEQSKSGKIIEKIEPSSAHAVTETDEIIITSLKRKSKLRLLSTNVENLDVKLTTLKPQKQKL